MVTRPRTSAPMKPAAPKATTAPALPEAPTNLREFNALFPDEAACRRYLYNLRWPDGFVCPRCSSTTAYPMPDYGRIACGNGHQVTLTSGTVMHRTKQPLLLWFHAAFLISTLTPGISALQFQREMGLPSYETAFHMLHKLRSALVAPAREPLRGEVEVDEAFFGGVEPGVSGRQTESKAIVVVGVELLRYTEEVKHRSGEIEIVNRVKAGRVRMNAIPDARACTLVPWVKTNVLKGAIVRTDGWGAYKGLAALGYDHRPTVQDKSDPDSFMPMVHLIISNAKTWLMGTHHGAVAKKHLQAYLNEYVFRFNRRWWRGPAFLRALVLMAGATDRPEYETLYAVGEPGGWEHPPEPVSTCVGAKRKR